MTARITTPEDVHRESIARLLATSLHFPLQDAIKRASDFRMDDFAVAIEGDDVVACAGVLPFEQWFGGRSLRCCGITRVGVLPEHRSGGLATACTDTLLGRDRERGVPIAALFPAVLRPYRRMGFEVAGTFCVHQVPLADLEPHPTPLSVKLVDVERDIAAVREAYREWVRHANGPVEPVDDEQWRTRFLMYERDDTFRAVLVREEDRVTALATFTRKDATGPLDPFGVSCHLMFALTPEAHHALMTYFHGYRGMGTWIQWPGSPSEPTVQADTEAVMEAEFRYPWMLRLLDVPAALEGRGYPPITCDVTITVDDPRWPENAGPWRLEVADGRARVSSAPRGGTRPIPVGALSSMFSGFLRATDAARTGVLDVDDPAVDALGAMFDGPDPWSPIFF